MVGDDERRRVAARLRSVAHEVMRSGYSESMKHVKLAVFEDLDQYRPNETLNRLADLIDPGESGQNPDTNRDSVLIESPAVQKAPVCDREALLALADEMCDVAWNGKASGEWTASVALFMVQCACRIRVACGDCHVSTSRDYQSGRTTYLPTGEDITRLLAIERAIQTWNQRS